MTSKLKTDVLETVSGSGTIALTNQLSGMTSASMPSGSVLQVQTGFVTSIGSTTSDAYVTTNLSTTITPKFTNSKILIDVMWSDWWNQSTPSANYATYTIYRNGVNISDNSTNSAKGSGKICLFRTMEGGSNGDVSRSMGTYHSPASTASQTYTLMVRKWSANADVLYFCDGHGQNVIKLTEIKQ